MWFNKFRLKVIQFIKKHEYKIKDVGQKLIIVAIVVLIATIVISSFSGGETEKNEDVYNVYKPTETIIKGQDVSKEQYEKDSNLVSTFLEYCNNKKVEEAYELLSDTCKEEAYPDIETFKTNYYNTIFDIKRECNLQSWITTSDYIVYKIRYSNSMLSTGTYQEGNVYQDYITLNRKEQEDKISIGNFVDSNESNIVTKTDELTVTVTKKRQYISYEEYDLNITNNTYNTILLNNLENTESIKLISSSGVMYGAYTSKLFLKDLIINSNETQKITIRFKKQFSSENNSSKIMLNGIIKDYDAYMENEQEYEDRTNITIKVED